MTPPQYERSVDTSCRMGEYLLKQQSQIEAYHKEGIL